MRARLTRYVSGKTCRGFSRDPSMIFFFRPLSRLYRSRRFNARSGGRREKSDGAEPAGGPGGSAFLRTGGIHVEIGIVFETPD